MYSIAPNCIWGPEQHDFCGQASLGGRIHCVHFMHLEFIMLEMKLGIMPIVFVTLTIFMITIACCIWHSKESKFLLFDMAPTSLFGIKQATSFVSCLGVLCNSSIMDTFQLRCIGSSCIVHFCSSYYFMTWSIALLSNCWSKVRWSRCYKMRSRAS